jgi:hypothetical protein
MTGDLATLALIRNLRNAITKAAGPGLSLDVTVLINALGAVAGEVLAMLPDETRQGLAEIITENADLWRATNSNPNKDPSFLTHIRLQ